MNRKFFAHAAAFACGWSAVAGVSPAQELEAPLPPPEAGVSVPSEGVVSLDGISATAEAVSPNLREAAAAVQVARGRALQAGLYPNPTLNFGAGQLNGNQSQYAISAAQEFVTAGKLTLDQAAACREVDQARWRYQRTRFDLLTAVRVAFFEALTAQQRTAILEELSRIALSSQEMARKLEKGGEAAEADTLLLEIEVDRAAVALESARAQSRAAFGRLAAVAGVRDLNIVRIDGRLDQPIPDFAAMAKERGVLSDNALVQIARIEVDRTRILLRRAEVEPYPNVTANVGYLKQLVELRDLGVVEFSLPIPAWNRNQGNIAAAGAQIRRAVETSNRTENELAAQLAAAVGRFEGADQQVRIFGERILPKATRGLELTQRGFRLGLFDSLRVLQTQRALFEAQLGLLAALEARWSAGAEISGLFQWERFP